MISFVVYSQNDSIPVLKAYTYPSGKQSSKGYFKNKKPIGSWTNFYESGQISSYGKWNSNGLDSIWLFYSENGILSRSISFSNNLKNGRYLVYDSIQKIEFDGFYVNDTLQGPFKRYKNGKLYEEGSYSKGEVSGLLKEYDSETGRLITIKNISKGEEMEERQINRMVAGKKDGVWQVYNDKGKLISQEIYQNGILVSDQNFKNKPFEFEEEFYKNGQLKSRYVLTNGIKNGIQSNFLENGSRSISQVFKNDTLVAKGWYKENGLKDSLWQTFDSSGDISSKGKYKDGKKEGMWYYYFSNNRIEQKGRYFNDLPTGEWIWYYQNGQTRKLETYYKGKHEGDIIDYDSTGTIIQQQRIAYNAREGEYYYFIGDQQEQGGFENGLREGKWSYKYRNGKKAFVGKYKNGAPDGKHKHWFDNGKRAEVIIYKNGKRHGRRLEYAENGKLIHVYLYSKGRLISIDDVMLKEDKIIP